MTLISESSNADDKNLSTPRSRSPHRTGKRRAPISVTLRRNLLHLPLMGVGLVTLFPFLAMVALSLHPGTAVDFPGIFLNTDYSFAAYADALSNTYIGRWAINSGIYASASVVLGLLLASMGAYAFAKMRFLGRKTLFWIIIAMLMIPYQLTIVPQYLVVGEIGGLNSLWGLIVPTIANVQAMFLMHQFVQDIPDELIDAAKIDGAREFRIFWSLILPQTKPILATLATFLFLWHWNDFLWPLVAQQSPVKYVLTVGLNSVQEQNASLATLMATAVVTFIPALLVFIFFQRYFVRGVMMSGIK